MSPWVREGKTDFQLPPMRKLLKIVGFVALLCAPLLLMMMILTPLATRKAHERIVKKYQLPGDYTHQDIFTVVDTMKEDGEFTFYFYALDPDQIATAKLEAAKILDENRTKISLRSAVGRLQEQVNSASDLFAQLEIPRDFSQNPDKYPQLNNVMWQFLYEEFKLTILGVCYKATYDPEFVFQWSKSAHSSAIKLKSIITDIK